MFVIHMSQESKAVAFAAFKAVATGRAKPSRHGQTHSANAVD